MKTRVGYFRNARYTFKFIRELSSFIIALYSIYLLTLLYYYHMTLSDAILAGPLQMVLAIIALVFALIHSISWLYLMPRIVKVKVGGKELNINLVFGLLILIFLIITTIILVILI
ncbi:MAG TPA: hypothetical protein VKU94_03000 [Geobacterales bacterium]|nr:hypothetical protein [Geobacterales bacterium]